MSSRYNSLNQSFTLKNAIRVRVPATTANVGPGFDSLGIALQIYNYVDLKLTAVPEITLSSPLAPEENHAAIKMVMETARAFFRAAQMEECGMHVHIEGEVPSARGLGSSVTVRLGIIAGLNRLLGRKLDSKKILHLVSLLEGHPDNAAPALHGGLTVASSLGDEVVFFKKKLARKLRFVALIPDYEVETKKARKLLPASLPFSDAVQNVGRVSSLVASFWEEKYSCIGHFLEDRLHQPYRSALVPQLFPCLHAAKLAGAIGGWLSGSGSTIMAITLSAPEKVGKAMQKVFKDSGIQSRTVITYADNVGLLFEKSKTSSRL